MVRRKMVKGGKRTRETRDPETVIPSSLLDQLAVPEDGSTAGKGGGTSNLSRKEQRKRHRKEKKKAGNAATKEWHARRRLRAGLKEQDSRKPQANAASPPKPIEPVNELDSASREPTKKRKRKSNLSQEKTPVGEQADKAGAKAAVGDPEALEVRRLEKLLGVDRRKKRKSSRGGMFSYSDMFGEDEGDMADLLNFCDKSLQGSRTGAEVRDSDVESAQEDEGSGSDANGAGDMLSVAESESESEPESDEQLEQRELLEDSTSVRSSDEGDSLVDQGGAGISRVEHDEALKTGATSDADVDTHQETRPRRANSKYMPPGARGKGNAKLAISRRIRGLLNRVADANASGIAGSILQLFDTSSNGIPRDEIETLYVGATLDSVRDGSGVGYINPYIQSQAAIASHLAFQVDESVLAKLLVAAIRRIDVELEKIQENGAEENIMAEGPPIQSDAFGYVVLVCSLYEQGAISSNLIYDLVRTVAEPFTHDRLELLLVLLRQVGALLRQDDPSSLKDMIEFIREQSSKIENQFTDEMDEETRNVKLQVMLDLVNDIKNNKLKRSVLIERKAKFAWAGSPATPLSASIRDLLDDEFTATEWWIPDANRASKGQNKAFHGLTGSKERSRGSNMVHRSDEPDLTSLASSLRLNTEYRKALFKTIMSSLNVADAYERLERMAAFNAKAHHDRDTALVILHCCGSEKSFNPFYAMLAERMCLRARGLRFTFEFALWDIFKSIPGSEKTRPVSKRKSRNFGQMLAYLWNSGALSLSVLRCVADFEECGEQEKLFYTDAVHFLLAKLATKAEKGAKLAPFEKLRLENWNGVGSFRISLALFLRRSVQPSLSKSERSLLTEAVRILESVDHV